MLSELFPCMHMHKLTLCVTLYLSKNTNTSMEQELAATMRNGFNSEILIVLIVVFIEAKVWPVKNQFTRNIAVFMKQSRSQFFSFTNGDFKAAKLSAKC